jgi:hypothetical protein
MSARALRRCVGASPVDRLKACVKATRPRRLARSRARGWSRQRSPRSARRHLSRSRASAELRDARVVGFVNAGMQRRSGNPSAGVTDGQPRVLGWLHRPESRASRAFIEPCHAPIFGRQCRVAANGLLNRGPRVTAIEARRDWSRYRRLSSHDFELSDALVVSMPDALRDSGRTLPGSTGASVPTGEPSFLVTPQGHGTAPGASLCLIECGVEHAVTGAKTRITANCDFRQAPSPTAVECRWPRCG